jgi:hypothetical protein
MSSAMNKMIELKYVTCGRIHILCHLIVSATNCEKPILDTDWISAGGGHPPIASLDDIKTIADSMECYSGRVWSDSDVSWALSDNHMKKIEEARFVTFSLPEFSKLTKRNYGIALESRKHFHFPESRRPVRKMVF